MTMTPLNIWIVIVLLAIGTFLIRFSFLGLMSTDRFPPWAMRMLRYTPVAVLPGLVAPAVLWPAATDGVLDLPRAAAVAVTVLIGLLTRNTFAAIGAGAVSLYGLLWLVG